MRRYRFRNLVFDCLMVAITGGIWLIWMFNRNRTTVS